MVSKMALLNLLLASMALALDSLSSLPGSSLARHGDSESFPSLSLSGVESRTIHPTVPNSVWAGVQVRPSDGENMTYVTGIFVTPTLWGDNSSAMIWVGLNGASCQHSALRAGINLFIHNGVLSYNAWYQFVPSGVFTFPGISVSAGDEIRVTIVVANITWGVVMMDNLTAGQCFALDVFPQAPQSFCLENAEWRVEGPVPGSFGNLDSVTFTTAMASGTYTTYTPSEPASAVFYELVSQSGNSDQTLLTFINVTGSSIFVQRLKT